MFAGYIFGRRRHDAPRGPPVAYGSSERWKPRPYVRIYFLRRHGVVADVSRAVKSHVMPFVPHAGQEGGVTLRPRRDDEERGPGV